MPMYRVTWEIDVWADSPIGAAQRAREYQTDPQTTATVFDVIAEDSDEVISVDLAE